MALTPSQNHVTRLRRADCLGTGAAGVALLYLERARAGIGDWNAAQEWIATMAAGPIDAHPMSCSLFRGAPAVAFVLHSADRASYASALSALDEHIMTAIQQRLTTAHHRIDRGELPALREFDLISGLTGLGAYLLHRHDESDLLRNVLRYLTRLATEPLHTDGEELPDWWTGNGPDDTRSPDWPGGHGNLGMAHGIAGPLALLSITLRRGISVPGQIDAIARVCSWLDGFRCEHGTRAWWPGLISLAEHRTGTVRRPGPQRPSWCYGTPGLARAQQLAGIALNDPIRQRHAEQALLGCITDDAQLAQLHDPSLCHGWAGVLHTTWRAATDPANTTPELTAQLLNLRTQLEHHHASAHDGLLEGGTGIQLAQHTAEANSPPITSWDACLLLGN